MPVLFPPLVFSFLAVAMPQRVSPLELTPFLKVITASAGAPGRIACRDMDLSFELKKSGLSPDAKSPVAWAANEGQLKDYLAEGKLVVTGESGFLEKGAGIAIVREGGRPVILVDTRHVAAAGIHLSDALLKISRVK